MPLIPSLIPSPLVSIKRGSVSPRLVSIIAFASGSSSKSETPSPSVSLAVGSSPRHISPARQGIMSEQATTGLRCIVGMVATHTRG